MGPPDDADHDPQLDFIRYKETLAQSIVAEPLLGEINDPKNQNVPFDVIVDLNMLYPYGIKAARSRVEGLVLEAGGTLRRRHEDPRHPYVFATLTPAQIHEIVDKDSRDIAASSQTLQPRGQVLRGAIFRVWEDSPIYPLIVHSVATVKADAAQIAFSASGKDIVWAVVDSGIDETHPHFKTHSNLVLTPPLQHFDYVTPNRDKATEDPFGHGTHVAGIIAGELHDDGTTHPTAAIVKRDSSGTITTQTESFSKIGGMAPQCKLVSLRVLDDNGGGQVSAVIEAIQEIQRLNDYGRNIIVHGVNLSVGYSFDPKWYGCGQSPICMEVDRLVRSGVVVVVAAGNSGYGYQSTTFTNTWACGLPMTINDPGNSALATTVGSTHREKPHTYGISYFSSKGPTGDGRSKPDLVAPGERIISCATGANVTKIAGVPPGSFQYVEDSGTSMAAPHVSGVMAGFLSIRPEYIGQPEQVKQLFCDSATDLKREAAFQGAGLVDLMRAIQQV